VDVFIIVVTFVLYRDRVFRLNLSNISHSNCEVSESQSRVFQNSPSDANIVTLEGVTVHEIVLFAFV